MRALSCKNFGHILGHIHLQTDTTRALKGTVQATSKAAAVLAPLLNQPPPSEPRLRRHHARAEALAAAICSSWSVAPIEAPVSSLRCGGEAQSDSVRDRIESLERLGWDALNEGRLRDAIRIAAEPFLARAGSEGSSARAPAALAYERLEMPDSAAAIYDRLVHRTAATFETGVASIVRRSFALRRLAAFEGQVGERAREQLRSDWVDAEPEFWRRVVEPLVGTER